MDPNHLVVQNFVFSNDVVKADGLFGNAFRQGVQRLNNLLEIKNFIGIDLDTIINAFPAGYFREFTTATHVRLRGEMSGEDLEVKIIRIGSQRIDLPKKLDDQGDEIAGICHPCGNFESDWIPIDSTVDRFAARITCTSASIKKLFWEIYTSEPIRFEDTVLGITTFKREQDVVTNVNKLLKQEWFDIFVKALVLCDHGFSVRREQFPRCASLVLLHQENLGGTGGFYRCKLEAERLGAKSVLFMDDDILLEPDMVFRAITFRTIAKSPIVVGGMMMMMTHPARVWEQGGGFDWTSVNSIIANSHGVDAADRPSRLQLDKPNAVDFNGWWFCLLPLEEFPQMPAMFVKRDDIYVGLSLQQSGVPTVTPPHIFVWHEDYLQRPLSWQLYYDIRNELLIRNLLGRPASLNEIRPIFREIYLALALYDYGRAEIILQALEDYISGPSWLTSQRAIAEKHRNISGIITLEPMPDELRKRSVSQKYQRSYGKMSVGRSIKRFLHLATLWGHFNPFAKDGVSGGCYLEMYNVKPKFITGLKSYCIVHTGTKMGYVCQRSTLRMCGLLLRLLKITRNIAKNSKAINAAYHVMNFDQIYWNNIFNLDNHKVSQSSLQYVTRSSRERLASHGG
jgi:GT2 family glycosyltransferase